MVNLLTASNGRRNLKFCTADGHVRCRSAKSGDKSFDSFGKYPLVSRIRFRNHYDFVMDIRIRFFIQQYDLSFHLFRGNEVRSCLIDFHHIQALPVQNHLRQIQFPELLIFPVSSDNFFFHPVFQFIQAHILGQLKVFDFQPGQIISGNFHDRSCPYQKFQNQA